MLRYSAWVWEALKRVQQYWCVWDEAGGQNVSYILAVLLSIPTTCNGIKEVQGYFSSSCFCFYFWMLGIIMTVWSRCGTGYFGCVLYGRHFSRICQPWFYVSYTSIWSICSWPTGGDGQCTYRTNHVLKYMYPVWFADMLRSNPLIFYPMSLF